MKGIKKTLINALEDAGRILNRYYNRKIKITYKGEIDPVTEADRYSEKKILERIKDSYPGHNILTEESGEEDNSSDYCWVIDPLDGTVNYSHGLNIFSVSIAVLKEGRTIAGGVYDPLRKELFYAEMGKGAFLNGKKVTVSTVEKVSRALLVTGFPYSVHKESDELVKYFHRFLTRAQAVRRLGSACLDLAYVACGRMDGFWERGLKPWDTAAGALIVQEAGGKVTDIGGHRFDIFGSSILAANSSIHAEMKKILKRRIL